ncbi:MAG: hypothetical protein ACRBDI_09485 [Alphaproteobacteria bacterium]
MTTPKDLTLEEIATIKGRIIKGDKHQDISADYRLNIGRISDLKYGKIYPQVHPADLSKDSAKLKPLKFKNPSNDQSSLDLFKKNKDQ